MKHRLVILIYYNSAAYLLYVRYYDGIGRRMNVRTKKKQKNKKTFATSGRETEFSSER